ncbi:MAG: dihydropteroate synthase [Phycisphaerales bacterium]|nr:dihydropteroate synthase [Phycisphaerales bacterium]
MAIINVTSDSFSDGGLHEDPACACVWACECIEAGASIVDVGGESTRPGAKAVSEAEQIARVVPAIALMRRIESVAEGSVAISVDTTRAMVAAAALDAGATIINDVSAGEDDPEMIPLAAARGCGLVLMHRLRRPEGDSYSDRYQTPPEYSDVVVHVRDYLGSRVRVAIEGGVEPRAIAIDPGLGFGKTVEQNFELMSRLSEIVALGHPVLVSASRKSFLGVATAEANPARRDALSVDAALLLASAGAAIVRAHAVKAHADALKGRVGANPRSGC